VVDSLVFDRGSHFQGGVASLPVVEDFEEVGCSLAEASVPDEQATCGSVDA